MIITTGIELLDEWIADLQVYPPHAWVNDPREPLFTFMWKGTEFGFYAMSLTYWMEICFVLAFEGILAACFSFLVYKYIIPNKKTRLAYLIGYAFIIPFWMVLPARVVNWMDVRNKVFRFCITAVTPALCVFRTTEAMHGFTPEHALLDAKAFAIYFGLPMVAKYDKHTKEYVKATPDYLQRRFLEVIFSYLSTGTVYTVFLMFPDYFPIPGTIYTEHYFSPSYIFTPLYIRNAAFYCLVFQTTLGTSGNGGNFASSLLTGYEMEPFMKNPIFESNTCAEFWNKRWNKLIQNLLSRGIYKPCRTILPTYAALAATFTVSGLFHEWLMINIFAPLPEQLNDDGSCTLPKCFTLTHGSPVVFFVWVSFVITLEFMFTPKRYFKEPVIWYKFCSSTFTSFTALFFLDPYVHTRFFNEGYVGYFMAHPLGDMP